MLVRKMRPFNYGRLNLWSNVVNFGVVWLCLMGIMAISDGPVIPISCLILEGLLITAGIGLYV